MIRNGLYHITVQMLDGVQGGYQGVYTDETAEADGVSLAGKQSIRFGGRRPQASALWRADRDNRLQARMGRSGMLNGLYKVEMHTVHGSRRGVLYVYDGKMMGGNSAFAFIGAYHESDRGEVSAEISTLRHNEDPNFQPLFKTDKITLSLKGRQQGEQYFFEGGTTQLPGVAFNSVMTPISEEAAPPVVSVGKGGISNGLYSIHIRMLDGIDGGNTGVMVLHDGKIRGGDAFFDYIGAYTSANGRWKGELVNHEHTPNQGERPVFGGYEVGIGFSGTYTDEGAVAEATALAGKRSIRFSAVLKKLAEA